MIPIVNDKHRYILMYSAKAGSTSSRLLYLLLHRDELSSEQQSQLNFYHNLSQLYTYDPEQDYSDYTKFLITRNPYSRVVSAFLDQFAYAKNLGVQAMLRDTPPDGDLPDTFLEFLYYLKSVSDAKRDTHFQSQAYFVHADLLRKRTGRIARFFASKAQVLNLDFVSDIRDFNKSMHAVYENVFKANPEMQEKAFRYIAEMKKSNSSFYGERDFDDAATLTISELDELTFSPKPQDFYRNKEAQTLVEKIYAEDFALFNYPVGELPHKGASKEIDLIPQGFDWQAYLKINVDLPRDEIYNERSVLRHYLEFGRFEDNPPRIYKIDVPEGFDWQRYLFLHDDLRAAGIDSEIAAITHYLTYGVREQREI